MSIFRLDGLLLFLSISLYFLSARIVQCTENEEISTTNSESNHTDETMCPDGHCLWDGQQDRNSTVVVTSGKSSSATSDDLPNTIPNEGAPPFEMPAGILWAEMINPRCMVENIPCRSLDAECLQCDFNYTCVYGMTVNVTCRAIHNKCEGPREFEKTMTCAYCYQTPPADHVCNLMGYCNTAANPLQRYRSNCTVKSHILCLGQRRFLKNIVCNWTSGYRWSTALILSITLGGFGADRFYLGHWQEGIGKLFSFGGAGVWTIIDVILVAVGYLKPADGSVYI